jgi:hypothetical protein
VRGPRWSLLLQTSRSCRKTWGSWCASRSPDAKIVDIVAILTMREDKRKSPYPSLEFVAFDLQIVFLSRWPCLLVPEPIIFKCVLIGPEWDSQCTHRTHLRKLRSSATISLRRYLGERKQSVKLCSLMCWGKRGDGHKQLVAVPLVRDVLLEMLREKENHVTAASQCKRRKRRREEQEKIYSVYLPECSHDGEFLGADETLEHHTNSCMVLIWCLYGVYMVLVKC